MHIVNYIHAAVQAPPAAVTLRPGVHNEIATRDAQDGDVAEFSDSALALTDRGDLTNVRARLIDSVRRQIDEGNYESPEKVDVTVDRILADLAAVDLRA